MKKRIIGIILILIMAFSIMPQYIIFASEPSDWAIEEIKQAESRGLTTDSVMKDYQANITREQFCELAVKLYEKLNGVTLSAGDSVFEDTSNPEVLKAYYLNIVSGVSQNQFCPEQDITRQELCAMAVRAIYEAIDTSCPISYKKYDFSDEEDIASWAKGYVQYAYEHSIIKGMGDNSVSPLSKTSCEQAILIVNRIYSSESELSCIAEEKTESKTDSVELNLDMQAAPMVSVKNTRESDCGKITVTQMAADCKIATTAGKISTPVKVETENEDEFIISFKYDKQYLGNVNINNLAIACYDPELGRMKLIPSTLVESQETVSCTAKLAEFILVDTVTWYNYWKKNQIGIRNIYTDTDAFNVVFAIDASGSMSGNRNQLSKSCTNTFISNLIDDDVFSVLTFESEANALISNKKISEIDDMSEIKDKVNSIEASGGTNIEAAIRLAIDLYNYGSDSDGTRIMVLLSDGEATVDENIIKKAKAKNIKILTVSMDESADTELLQRIADETNGQFFSASEGNIQNIFDVIRESYLGIIITEDRDLDGLPDKIEYSGMRNGYGRFIHTNINNSDTDGDGINDDEEMGELFEDKNVSDMDSLNRLYSYIFFKMESDPKHYDGKLKSSGSISMNSSITLNERADTADLNIQLDYKKSVANQEDIDNMVIEIQHTSCQKITSNSSSYKISDDGTRCIINIGKVTANSNISLNELITHSNKCKKGDHILKITARSDNYTTLVNVAEIHFPEYHEGSWMINTPTTRNKAREIVVGGSIVVQSSLELKGTTVKCNGNIELINGGMLAASYGANIDCNKIKNSGELSVSSSKKHITKVNCKELSVNSNGALKLSDKSVLSIDKQFTFEPQDETRQNLKNGSIYIYGNADLNKNFYASKTNCFRICGNERHNIRIKNQSPLQSFGNLELNCDLSKCDFIGDFDLKTALKIDSNAMQTSKMSESIKELSEKYKDMLTIENLNYEDESENDDMQETYEDIYIYGEKDFGEDLWFDTNELKEVETPNDAKKEVEEKVKDIDDEIKKSSTGLDKITSYAEEAAAQAGTITVDDSNVVINDEILMSAASSVNEAINKIDTVLKTNSISPQRKYRRKVRINVPQNQEITIEKNVLSSDIESVDIVTDFATVNLDADSQESISIANMGSSKVKIDFNTDKTNLVKVQFPNLIKDTKYTAVVDENGNAVGGKYNPIQDVLEAKIASSGIYSVIDNEKDFTDIKTKNAEMQNAIKVLASKGIINGTSEEEFSPDKSISRAEVATLVVKTLSKLDANEDGKFSDVTRENWYFSAAGSSKRYGIINGYEDNTFRGEVVIPKDQILIVAARVLKNEMGYYVPNNVNSYLPYADSAEIADWAREDLALATAANLVVKRTDGKFVGAEDMTRGDAAIVLYRMFMKIW